MVLRGRLLFFCAYCFELLCVLLKEVLTLARGRIEEEDYTSRDYGSSVEITGVFYSLFLLPFG